MSTTRSPTKNLSIHQIIHPSPPRNHTLLFEIFFYTINPFDLNAPPCVLFKSFQSIPKLYLIIALQGKK